MVVIEDDDLDDVHMTLVRDGSGAMLTDNHTEVGTWVDERMSHRVVLRGGEQVRLGGWRGVVEWEDAHQQPPAVWPTLEGGVGGAKAGPMTAMTAPGPGAHAIPATREEDEPAAQVIRETSRFEDLDSIFLKVEDDAPALRCLYRLLKRLNGVRDRFELLDALADLCLSTFEQATHVSILLNTGTTEGTYVPVIIRARAKEDGPSSASLSRTLLRYVLSKREAIIFTDQDQALREAQSFMASQLKSGLVAPLWDHREIRGLVLVESKVFRGLFRKKHLELATLMANQAALMLSNLEMTDNLLKLNTALQQKSEELTASHVQLQVYSQGLEQEVGRRTAQLAAAVEEAVRAREAVEQANLQVVALNERLKEENLRLGAELDVARRIQAMVLPPAAELAAVPGMDIGAYMMPAAEVGGDYYDVIATDGGVKIGIGDVTGHGLESGVLMLMVQTAVRTLLTAGERDPVRFMATVNRVIFDNVQRTGMARNLTLSLMDYKEGRLCISGQHEDVILVRGDGTVELVDTVGLGFPVGMVDDIQPFVSSCVRELSQGDVVVLYTDGITEAESPDRRPYGVKQLCDLVRNLRQESAAVMTQAIVQDVLRHVAGQKVLDDVTVVVLKRA
jgi:serine phosphatase RsbU (regulator of sigma subunit)